MNTMKITAKPVFLKLNEKKAQVIIETTVDGHVYKTVHMSGPIEDVQAYFDGKMTIEEVQRRWEMVPAVLLPRTA